MRARCDAAHPRDARAVQKRRRAGRARDRRGDVRAVPVGIGRRAQLARVQFVGEQKSVEIVPGADQFVVAGVRGEPVARLAGAAKARRRSVDAVASGVDPMRAAQPQAEPRCSGPPAIASARQTRHGIAQRRVMWRDAAVDDSDDHVLAAQTEIGAQAPDRLLESEEDGALVCLQLLQRVRPNPFDLGALREPRDLTGVEPGGETVQRVAKAVDLLARRPDRREQLVVGLLEMTHVARDGGSVAVESLAGRRLGGGERAHAAFVARRARVLQLHDVNPTTAFRARDLAACAQRLGHGADRDLRVGAGAGPDTRQAEPCPDPRSSREAEVHSMR